MTQYEFAALHRALTAIKVAREALHQDDRAQALVRIAEAEAIVDVRLQITNVEGA